MKCMIIYSSQTGNTERIAFAIQKGISKITGQCDVVRMRDANPKCLYEYDLIGIGAPTHLGKEPIWVDSFIKDLRYVGGKHCFVFSTHGALPANFMPVTIPMLKKKGLIVIGYSDWYGDGHAQHHAYPWYTAGHPDETDLCEAESFGREMANRSKRITAGEIDLIPEVPPMIDLSQFPPEKIKEGMTSLRKSTKYEKDKCLYPKCRLCMDNCPTHGIDITVDPPRYMQPCGGCGGICEAICPTGAINWDDWFATPTPPAEKEFIVEFGEKVLKEAEYQGRFRRLMPEKEVNWDTRVYKVFNKHPRWIIGKGRP